MTLKEQVKIHDKLRNPECGTFYRTTDLVSPSQCCKKGIRDYKRSRRYIQLNVHLYLDPS